MLGLPNVDNLVQGEHPKNSGGIGVGLQFLAESLQYLLKQGKVIRYLIGSCIRVITRFRLVPKSTTLDDLKRPLRTLLQNTCFFGAHHENLNEDNVLSAGEYVFQ